MTGSHRTTVSPSSSRMSLRSPCIAGCCGPMFMSMVSSPNSSLMSGLMSRLLAGSVSALSCSVRRSSLSMPLPQSLEGALGADLEALEQRMVVEVVLPHVRPPQVGMTGERDPEHIVGLPLVPVGRRVDARDSPYDGLITLDNRLDPDPSPTEVHQLVGQLEGTLPVYDRDKGEVRDTERPARGRQHSRDVAWICHDPHDVAHDLRLLQAVPIPETIQVAPQAGLEIPLRQREGHLGVLLVLRGVAVGIDFALLLGLDCPIPGGLGFCGFSGLRLFLELLLYFGRDPPYIRLGGWRH